MISGISAMMQVGNNINSLIPLSVLKIDNYSNSSLAEYDRKIMKVLYSQSVPDNDICNYVKDNIGSPKYENGETFISTGSESPSTHKIFLQNWFQKRIFSLIKSLPIFTVFLKRFQIL